jgi:hypothetical protein
MPVRATISSTMLARIAMAVRPKSDEVFAPLGAVGDGMVSADTVVAPEAEVKVG